VDKTTYELEGEVMTALVLPKTLQAQTEMLTLSGAKVPMYPVYGRTDDDQKVWCATFLDSDEAGAWVQASKVFGRAVRGAVVSTQEKSDGAGTDGGESAQKPH
jgi:hypothetical protein